jgi:hypothetical protein
MTPFNLKPAAEALGIALVVEAFVALLIFGVCAFVWAPVPARLM